jgi:hypothetical protein
MSTTLDESYSKEVNMHCKLIRTLGLTIVALCLGLSWAIADIKTVKGKIENIDLNDASFTLLTEENQVMAFKVTPTLLEDLKSGDDVLVTLDDEEVIAVSPDKEEES